MDKRLKEFLENIKRWINAYDDPRHCDLAEGIGFTRLDLEVEKIKILARIASALEQLAGKGQGE